jgi:hypothetical protein
VAFRSATITPQCRAVFFSSVHLRLFELTPLPQTLRMRIRIFHAICRAKLRGRFQEPTAWTARRSGGDEENCREPLYI